MKVLVANPEVPWGVTESLTVAVPVAVEELVIAAVILLCEYPAITTGRRLGQSWSSIEMFSIFVTSCRVKRVELSMI